MGSGSQKVVHRATMDGVDVAVMTPRNSSCSLKTDLTAMTKAMGAKHVLQLIGGDESMLVSELATMGSVVDLADTLEFAGKRLTPSDTDVIMSHVSVGVDELRQQGLCHGDLHPRNVLVFSYDPLVAKLGDLGECCEGDTQSDELRMLERELHALM